MNDEETSIAFASANDTLDSVYDCRDHPQAIPRPIIRDVVVADYRCSCEPWGGRCGSWCRTWSFCVFYDEGGTLYAAEEWWDSTSHDCRCDGTIAIFDTIENALLLGLDDRNRERARELLALSRC